jgi:F-type H+-transporting ATPase subunit b
MFYLLDFEPIKPDIGLIFWTTIIFGLFWLIVGRFAFKPIASALRKRELDIQTSLDQAKHARQEMANLKAENDKLLAQAREERARILKEAKDAGEHIVQESKQRAKEEAQKIVTSAKAEIEGQKKQAIIEVKNQVGNMALDIAEQVLRLKLQDDKEQQALVNTLVKEIKFN